MPRIEAGSIGEHVARRQARILEVAIQIFCRKGFRATDMGDIAAEVGLARNSLYRYYPGKDELLLAAIEHAMQPHLLQVAALDDEVADPVARVHAWVGLQVDFAVSPVHAPLELIHELRATPELKRRIRQLHRLPNGVLERAVAAALAGQPRDIPVLCTLITGMTEAGSLRAMSDGSVRAVRQELRHAIDGLLAGSTSNREAS